MWFLAAAYAVKAYGQWQQQQAQGDAEFKNAQFYGEQADMTAQATQRQLMIYQAKATKSLGDTVGAYAHGNVGLSASTLDIFAGERQKATREEDAIQREGNFRTELARLRQQQSFDTAQSLTGSQATFSTLASGFLGAGSAASK